MAIPLSQLPSVPGLQDYVTARDLLYEMLTKISQRAVEDDLQISTVAPLGISGIAADGSAVAGIGKTATLKGNLQLAMHLPVQPQYGGTGGGIMTLGSIPFVGPAGVYWQDNGHLFWDVTHARLGIGKTNPATAVDVAGTVTATAFVGPLTGNASTATSATTAGSATTATSATVAGGLQVPRVHAYANAAQAISSLSYTQIVLGATTYDTSSNFNTSTSTFTAPSAGVYFVEARVVTDQVSLTVSFRINGSFAHLSSIPSSASTFGSINGLVYMGAGDTLTVYVFCAVAANVSYTSSESTMLNVWRLGSITNI